MHGQVFLESPKWGKQNALHVSIPITRFIIFFRTIEIMISNLIHKLIAPEERKKDGYLTRIFPQFAKTNK